MSSVSDPPPELDVFSVPPGRFWAKLHPRDAPAAWHPLIAHSADVAAVLERLLHPSSVLARRLGWLLDQPTLTERQRAQLVFSAALHDLGKTSHGFQTKAGRGIEGQRWKNLNRGHVQVLLSSLRHKPLAQLLLNEVFPHLGTEGRAVSDFFGTIIAHHGRPHVPAPPDEGQHKLWTEEPGGRDPIGEMRRIIGHARRWSGMEAADGASLFPLTPAFMHLFAGTLTLADWIGSTRGAFPFTPEADDAPDAYWQHARARAADACARIGLVPRTRPISADLTGLPLLDQLFPSVFGTVSGHSPNDLQRHIASMPLPEPGTRLLVESETGSGKTEAALTLYARLRAAGLVGGLMFALPTRSTASAMYERVKSALAGIYPDGDQPTLALAIGGQQPRSQSTDPLAGEQPITHPDQPELERWASSSNKKFLAAEVVVGTVDQVLLGGLPVKHAHLRLAALSRHLLVVDELHSYDRYMTGVLRRVLDLHTGAGGIALFMSATLSDAARTHFARGPKASVRDGQTYTFEGSYDMVPYPALASLGPREPEWQFHGLASQGRPKTIEWRVVAEAEAIADAVAAAMAGARVLLLCNTVRRARAAVQAVHDAGHASLLWQPPAAVGSSHTPPYHARYTVPDRLALDSAISERFGKHASAIDGGVILVATQVAEQSLDVDFDLLITDLAPIDVLLQRIGRLHRHPARTEHRPIGYRAPRALVIGPEGGSFVSHLTNPHHPLGWGEDRPYRHFVDGELTLRAVVANPTIVIPADNRRLVEGVYHADAREPLWSDPAWDRSLCDTASAEANLAWMGEQAALDFAVTYTECAAAFAGAREQRIRTRLGDETVRVELPNDVHCWYADPPQPVRSVDIPVWALPSRAEHDVNLSPPIWDPDGPTAGFRLANRRFRYGPYGWSWETV